MAIELPQKIAEYFEADRGKDAEAVVQCFAEGAVVKDEGHTHAGRDAIRAWKAEASAKYTYTVEPFAITTEGGRIMVTGGIGTFLTNDVGHAPLNIVIKLIAVDFGDGPAPVVKLSDDAGKYTGERRRIEAAREELGIA